MQISAAQNKTAGELVDLVANVLGSGRAVQSETAIASAARLAGSLLLRSFDLNIDALEPGSVILSNEANEQGCLAPTSSAPSAAYQTMTSFASTARSLSS